MERIESALSKKLELVVRKREVMNQLASKPREVFEVALKKELGEINAEIMTLDEAFFYGFSEFKSKKKLMENGDIDVNALSESEKATFRNIQSIIKDIASV